MEFMFVCIGLFALSLTALQVVFLFTHLQLMETRKYNLEYAKKTYNFCP